MLTLFDPPAILTVPRPRAPLRPGTAPATPCGEVAVRKTALISGDGIYRYNLTRRWAPGPLMRWIMLNPSTADAVTDDPTIRRCMAFARGWGYSGLLVHNLFALRAKDPRALLEHPDPVGPDNDEHLRRVDPAMLTVCAWGTGGVLHDRGAEVLALLEQQGPPAKCLGRIRAGEPRHPLYLAAATELVDLQPPAATPTRPTTSEMR